MLNPQDYKLSLFLPAVTKSKYLYLICFVNLGKNIVFSSNYIEIMYFSAQFEPKIQEIFVSLYQI